MDHDVYGFHELQAIVRANNRLELLDTYSGTRYFLNGYTASNFDYDALFYHNIQYFLQEYGALEKTYISQEGAINEFDTENYLRFRPSTNADIFESSQDKNGLASNSLSWDYSGQY
jgi:hypothetical protein